jgi:hypothetical protein
MNRRAMWGPTLITAFTIPGEEGNERWRWTVAAGSPTGLPAPPGRDQDGRQRSRDERHRVRQPQPEILSRSSSRHEDASRADYGSRLSGVIPDDAEAPDSSSTRRRKARGWGLFLIKNRIRWT